MPIEDDIAFLERVPTLGQLGRQALRILAIGAETRYLRSGQVLFSAGEDADAAYVVHEGRFSLSPGNGAVLTVGPGTLLGELALFTETKRPATATALDSATVLRIPRPLFMKMLDSFPAAARKLREIWAARLDQSERDLGSVRAVLDSYDSK
jgi:CRP-like cAMP-binding protein